MNDMARVIIPDSTQINADELQAGPITIKIAGVKIKGGKEQPVDIIIEGMEKVYRPCKSMCRCLVAAWGPDSSKYVGRSLTLYCDPSVKWGGLAVGGLRISHMSDLDENLTMALTVTRANKKPFTVRPLSQPSNAAASKSPPAPPSGDAAAPTPQSDDCKACLQAADNVKGQKGAAAVQSMIDKLTNPAEQKACQDALNWVVRDLKAKSQTRKDADARVGEIESDKL